MSDFLHMGGYAAFVWPAYGATFLVLAIVLAVSLGRLRARQRTLREIENTTRGSSGSQA